MANTPPFAEIVPAGWNLDTLLTLIASEKGQVKFKEAKNGELLICTGYREREDGCLVKFIERGQEE